MSFVDSFRIDGLARRVEAIEARQRAYGMHDPECPVRRTQIAQRTTDAYLVSPPCACWLAEDGNADAS